jgi:hypothetical protein
LGIETNSRIFENKLFNESTAILKGHNYTGALGNNTWDKNTGIFTVFTSW